MTFTFPVRSAITLFCAAILSAGVAQGTQAASRELPAMGGGQQGDDAGRHTHHDPLTYGHRGEHQSALHLFDMNAIDSARRVYVRNPNEPGPAIQTLINRANKVMGERITSVMDKTAMPPSRDKHDFMCISIYKWPNPSTPNGLPYIDKDGQVNPQNEISFPDKTNIERMADNVKNLTLAYMVTGNPEYGRRAAEWIRSWFMDPRTRMNPNMNYAGATPGKNEGEPNGIIYIHFLPELLDEVSLLKESKLFAANENEVFEVWSREFLSWLVEGKFGRKQVKNPANIGMWYDTEVVSLALFTRNDSLARQVSESAKQEKIAAAIDQSGLLHEEIRRTAALGYSGFALEALFELAHLADNVSVDLWHYESPEGASIKKAFDFLVPYVVKEKPWPYRQIHEYAPSQFYNLIYQAVTVWGERGLDKYLADIDGVSMAGDVSHITYAIPAVLRGPGGSGRVEERLPQ